MRLCRLVLTVLASLCTPKGTGAPSRRRLAVVLATAAFALLACALQGALGAAPAFAATAFPRLGQINGPAPGSSFGHLGSESVAVNDSNGHVLVADSGVGVVYDFASASDTSPAVWNGASTPAKSFGGGLISVAVDNASGDVYVADVREVEGQGHGFIYKFDASGNLIESFGDSSPAADGQLAGLATPAKSFSHPDGAPEKITHGSATPLGIAVDQATHALYVIDSGHRVIDVFNAAGAYERQITATPVGLYNEGFFDRTDGIAVNASSGHVFVSNSTTNAVFEFDALGNPVETWTGVGSPSGGFDGYLSVAVNNSTGDFYVPSTYPESVVDQFTSAGVYVAQIVGATSTESLGTGVAVDQATGGVYVSDNVSESSDSAVVRIFGGEAVLLPDAITSPATTIGPRSATLHGTVNPEGVEITDCRFEYVEEAVYAPSVFDPYASGGTVPCVETVGAGSEPVEVHADVSGLQVGTTYHFRLLASNANGREFGQDATLATLPRPAISRESATNLTRTSADLGGRVNPGGVAIEACDFEYGEEVGVYPHKIECSPAAAQIGSGTGPVSISAHVEGLVEDRTYHWRVVAKSEAGTTASLDHTFVYSTSGGGLPDNRAYEMVTPPGKNGALIGDVFLGLPPAFSQDGSRMILPSVQCFGNAESCIINRAQVGAEFESQRTAGGWQTSSLSPPTGLFETNAFWTASADTGDALYSMPTPPHGEDDLYVRRLDGTFTDIGPTSPPGEGARGAVGAQSADTRAATADFSHYVYGMNFKVWPFDATTYNGVSLNTLYEYVGTGNTEPLLVGVAGSRGSHDLISTCGTNLGTGHPSSTYPGALSEDGSVVFFTATGSIQGSYQAGEPTKCFGTGVNAGVEVPANTLYARIGESETVRVSERSPVRCTSAQCQGSPAGDAEFQGASVDGRRVFFTSTQQLTDAASQDPKASDRAFSSGCSVTVGANGCNLYGYDFAAPVGDRVVALSAGDSSGGGPRVQGVMAVSDDGSHVYFVAKGVLTAAGNSQGQYPVGGGDNLYVYERDSNHPTGSTRFIATLPATDDIQASQSVGFREWSEGSTVANVSPDGRFLVFASSGVLTSDTGGSGVLQVFRYDAASGLLVRVSHGEAGMNDNGNNPAIRYCENGECPDGASFVRTGAYYSFGGSYRRDPSMSNDGEYVFFTSPVGLTPRALNDVQIATNGLNQPVYAENVYEWHAGHVSLISDGRDVSVGPTALCGLSSSVCLAGSDVSGRNVFFTSSDRLVPQDTDTQVDFYDARVCSTEEPCVAGAPPVLPACLGEACHGTPAATPSLLAPVSVSFDGAGNLVSPASAKAKAKSRVLKCRRKGFVKRKGRCVRAKRASRRSNGRTGR